VREKGGKEGGKKGISAVPINSSKPRRQRPSSCFVTLRTGGDKRINEKGHGERIASSFGRLRGRQKGDGLSGGCSLSDGQRGKDEKDRDRAAMMERFDAGYKKHSTNLFELHFLTRKRGKKKRGRSEPLNICF